MRVTEIAVLPFAPADGSTARARGIVLLIETAEGRQGVGSAQISPASAEAALEVLRPLVVGAEFDSPEQAQVLLRRSLPGSTRAVADLLAALDVALWDVWGGVLDVPVSIALGGRHRERIRAAVRLPASALPVVAQLVSSGCTSFVIDGVPSETELLHLREAAGEGAVLAIACGGKLSRHQAMDAAVSAATAGAWLLDPLPVSDAVGYRILRATARVPILAGATAGATELLRLLEVPSVDGLVLDLERVGGLTVARTIAWAAEDIGAALLIVGSEETHAFAADLHLLAASSSDGIVIVRPPASTGIGSDGRIQVPAGVGLGAAAEAELERNP